MLYKNNGKIINQKKKMKASDKIYLK